MEQKIFQLLADIPSIVTAHGEGKKFVFLKNEDSASNLTQFAYGKFMPGEICKEHFHPTMEECFFFIKGKGKYKVNGETYSLQPGTFLRIPAGILHQLEAEDVLEFVYFGIAL
jgi:quercetin dioxygenase-like cupin family protein